MIALDTNVVSEALLGPKADPKVISWLRRLPERPVTTVVTRAELLAGVAVLPDGARRAGLEERMTQILSRLGACLPMTDDAAGHYADIIATRRASGRPAAGFDVLIASICRSSGAILATRNTRDFEGMGIGLVDPWNDQSAIRSLQGAATWDDDLDRMRTT